MFDDGTRESLYVGGIFDTAGGAPTSSRITKWDGSRWTPVGSLSSGLGGISLPSVNAMVVFDADGVGSAPPALYVGGAFGTAGALPARNIARWTGTSWQALGSGVGTSISDDGVYALTVYDDGTGDALFACGWFNTAGGVPAANIARWKNNTWSALGTGLSGPGFGGAGIGASMAVFDADGAGGSPPALIVGGQFTGAGGVAGTKWIARWNGTTWSSFGPALGGENQFSLPGVASVGIFDPDGAGSQPSQLIIGGNFTTSGTDSVKNVARWSNNTWLPLGTATTNGTNGVVAGLAAYDSGTGPCLYVSGDFSEAGGITSYRIARWSGTTWAAVNPDYVSSEIRAMVPWDDDGPTGPHPTTLFALGASSATVPATNEIASWDGLRWRTLGNGLGGVSSFEAIKALAVYNDGPGQGVFAAGQFGFAGGVPAFGLAKWNGRDWSSPWSPTALPPSNGYIRALAPWNTGGAGGNKLFVAGSFDTIASTVSGPIASWNGTAWAALDSGIGGFQASVNALVVHDDGTGAALYAAGSFNSAGSAGNVNSIARWNGTSWFAVGSGLTQSGNPGYVNSLASWNGSLYAGGVFDSAGGLPAANVARWSNGTWTAVSNGSTDGAVNVLRPFNDGTGPGLFVGGYFSQIGGFAANNIAKWNGSGWSTLGSGATNGTNGSVLSLAVLDDDANGINSLFVGGGFGQAGGVNCARIAKWNGTSWAAMGLGISNLQGFGDVSAMATWDDDGAGPHTTALFIGGSFTQTGPETSYGFARWGCGAATACYANCDASTAAPVLNINDFQCFINKFAAADPYANCDNSTAIPTLNVLDFGCFLNRFAAGCT